MVKSYLLQLCPTALHLLELVNYIIICNIEKYSLSMVDINAIFSGWVSDSRIISSFPCPRPVIDPSRARDIDYPWSIESSWDVSMCEWCGRSRSVRLNFGDWLLDGQSGVGASRTNQVVEDRDPYGYEQSFLPSLWQNSKLSRLMQNKKQKNTKI